MRIQVFSDCHNELRESSIFLAALTPAPDLILLAGDIAIRSEGVVAAQRLVHQTYGKNIPTVYINGNHEHVYSGQDVSTTVNNSRQAAQMLRMCGSNVHFLENESIELTLDGQKTRILGSTLWTDFSLGGKQDRRRAMLNARQLISDMQGAAIREGGGRAVTPEVVYGWHIESVAWLERTMALPFDGKTIVMTHFAPHCHTNPAFPDDGITSYFYSDLTGLMERYAPDLWVYGHTHCSFDRVIGKTRVVSNQVGYPGKEKYSGYQKELVVAL